MSYDLNFWRYLPQATFDPKEVDQQLHAQHTQGMTVLSALDRQHLAVYQWLCDGQQVAGLAELPIAAMLERVAQVFAKGWERQDTVTWEKSGGKGAFQVSHTPQWFRVDCYGMSGDDMNLLIDVGSVFDCPLFDPQVPKRFDGA